VSRARNLADLLGSQGDVKSGRLNKIDKTDILSKINDAVTAGHLASNSVGSSEIIDNTVTAAELKVTGNGTSGQYLGSDGDGSFTWTDISLGDVNRKSVAIQEHLNTITSSYTVPTGKNAYVTGGITIAPGASITVNAGSTFSFL